MSISSFRPKPTLEMQVPGSKASPYLLFWRKVDIISGALRTEHIHDTCQQLKWLSRWFCILDEILMPARTTGYPRFTVVHPTTYSKYVISVST